MSSDRDGPPIDENSLAARLNWLFEHVRKPDGERYTLREAATLITAAGTPISHAFIGQLLRGQKDDPGLRHLRGIAQHFGVPVEYFTSEEVAAGTRSELNMVAALQGLRAQSIALRESVIPEATSAIASMTKILEQIAALESRLSDQDPEA